MVYAFLMTKGGQQVPQRKSKAKAQARCREMMSEGAEQTPDVSPSSTAAHSVCEVRNAGTLDCSPKSANITEKPTAECWGSCAGVAIFSSTWNRLHVFFAQRKIVHGPLCKDDTYILFFEE